MAENRGKVRTIGLEEHYATKAFMDWPGQELNRMAQVGRSNPQVAAGYARLLDQLLDIGEKRIADMDASGIDLQVLSLTSPGTEQLEPAEAIGLAHDSNDLVAAAVKAHPDRFGAFAALPTPAPDAAADELERAVKELGLKGAVINGHTRGRYLDDPFFWPILERAEELAVPIYLHPTPPTQAIVEAYYKGNYSPGVTALVSTAGWGWHIETAIHVIRIILGGAFDKYPRLQFVIGHLGEALPFMLPRLEQGLPPPATGLQRPVGDYLRRNIHYTISGFNYLPAFMDLLLQVGTDRIMFSTDHPYGSMAQARDFLDRLPLSPADKERIAHTNAELLLRI